VQLGVVQFSNDVRTEVEIAPLGADIDAGAFAASISRVTRLNGGTNFCAPLRCGAACRCNAAAADTRAQRRAHVRCTRRTLHVISDACRAMRLPSCTRVFPTPRALQPRRDGVLHARVRRRGAPRGGASD
jgi:hypothetical protein